MKLFYQTPISYEIKRRTFEGKDNPLTSKYMPSYKYWIKIEFKEGNCRIDCYRTKGEAEGVYKEYLRTAGKPL